MAGLPARKQSPIQVLTGPIVLMNFVDQANALTTALCPPITSLPAAAVTCRWTQCTSASLSPRCPQHQMHGCWLVLMFIAAFD